MVDDTPEPVGSAGQPHTARPLRAALELVASGYYVAPVIIRRDPGTGKKLGDYLGIRWHDQSTLAPEIVTDWWAQYQCSFLVDTGRSGVFAADLDVPSTGPSGLDVWTGAGLGLPIMRVRTPGGGWHLYYRAPAGEPLTVHKRIHGHPIDVRGDGGHVYAPGSVVLDPYGVPELRGYEIVGQLVRARELQELPAEAAAFLHAERSSTRRTPSAQGEVRTRTAVVDILKGQVEKVAASERRTDSGFRATLLGAAMVWGRAVAGGIVTEEAARKRLERAAAAVWGTADADDRRNIRHGLEDGQADPWTVVPDDYDTTVSTATERDHSSSAAVPSSTVNPPSANRLSNGGAEVEPESLGGTGVAAHTGDELPAELAEEVDTWAPVARAGLEAILDGTVSTPMPAVGVRRSDDHPFLYPGLEHAVIGEAESGKSWFALACVAAELKAGQRVVYLHFEEADATSTVLRLHHQLHVPRDVLLDRFVFVGPERRITPTDVDRLMAPGTPSLVVLDGVNEAMALHGMPIYDPEGAADYRRRLVKPWKRAGAAVVSLDHVPKDAEGRAAGIEFGTVMKGNGLDGARIVLENVEPFGDGRRGVSRVYVTKDRHGQLRKLGTASSARNASARKTFVGQLIIDAETAGAWRMEFRAPFPDGGADNSLAPEREEADASKLRQAILAAVKEAEGRREEMSRNDIRAAVKKGQNVVHEALSDLVRDGQLTVVTAPSGKKTYAPA